MSVKNSSFVFRLFSVLVLLTLLVSAMGVTPAHAAGTRYAKPVPSGAGTCLSWATACTLQTALNGAASGEEIWVAAGTHKPTTGTDRTVTFQLKGGVAVYGGFVGIETARDQRNPVTHLTALSGEIGAGVHSDNSYHVVTGATGATLDGFTITDGEANSDTAPNDSGGGMYNDSASPTLTNVIFDDNRADTSGGGMYNTYGSSPTLTNVTFSGNLSSGDGGGMYNTYSSSPTLTNVTFSSNQVSNNGGGMYNDGSSPILMTITFNGNVAGDYGGGMVNVHSSPTLTNVTFSGNSATGSSSLGGGMANVASSPILTNVTFSNNSASWGGGMVNWGSSSPTLTNVTFSANSATGSPGIGGGMLNVASSPILTNITFSGNSAISAGGGMYNDSSSPTLTNVTFSGNSATSGGGMANASSSPTLTNVTFSGNSATDSGGGMADTNSSNPQIRNSIFWGNTAPNGGEQIYNDSGTPVVSDSVIQGGCIAGSTCTHIIPSDPLLGTLGNNGGFTQTIPLLAGSSAIDTGNDTVCPATDQRGVTRTQGAHCDIGAYEASTSEGVATYRRATGGAYWLNYDFATASFIDYLSLGDGGSTETCYPAPMDFDGDGGTERTHLCGGGWHFFETNGAFVKSIFAYMQPGDIPVPGDYNGDGKDEVAVYRRVTGGAYWLFYDFATASFTNYVSLGDGGSSATCYPAAMDFDGDGVDELTHLCGGGWHFFETNGAFVKSIFAYMQPGDMPIPGDYNGDGKDDVAVYRRVTGGAYWLSYDFATASLTDYISLGDGGSSATCYPAAMDFDADGIDERTHLCGGGWHFFETNGAFVKSIFTYMQVGDKPAPGKYGN